MQTLRRPLGVEAMEAQGIDLPSIGLSANVLAADRGSARHDGIGVYTQALEHELVAMGIPVSRVSAPTLRRWLRGSRGPNEPAFRYPLSLEIARTALTGRCALGGAAVEAAVDVYHATDYLVPQLRRTPVVATVYDAIPLAHPEWANQRLRRIKNRLLRASVSRADLVIAISKAAVGELVEFYGVPEARVRVVPLGVDPRWTEPPPVETVRETLARHRLEPGFFMFVGTLQPRKNLETLLAAYDRLPAHVVRDRQLVIVGKYGWGAESLRLELIRRTAAGRCVWLDYVDAGMLRGLYSAAGAFVFPSLAEGYGLPVLEALAAGLPIVASDLPVLREVAGNMARFVPARDADAMAAAMLAAAGDAQTDSVREARRAHARGADWRTCARRTVEVYRELLQRS